MLDSDTKKFINDIVIGFSDELRLILTDFMSGLREINEVHCYALEDVSLAIGAVEERLCEIGQTMSQAE
jgi:hypothetical protein